MKKVIKLKTCMELSQLLKKPEEFTTLVKIAVEASAHDIPEMLLKKGETRVDDIKLGILEGLEAIGQIEIRVDEFGAAARIISPTIIDMQEKTEKEENDLNKMLLAEVPEDMVPEKHLEYFKMAKAFRELFIQNLKKLSEKPFLTNLERAKFKDWVDPIRLMIEQDKVEIDQLRKVYSYLNGHSFWSPNCLTTSKLREKFQLIYSQSNRDGNKRGEQRERFDEGYLDKIRRDLSGGNA